MIMYILKSSKKKFYLFLSDSGEDMAAYKKTPFCWRRRFLNFGAFESKNTK